VWESAIDGKVLHFSLFGINNQNFIMQDRETKSWWQQVSGEAIHGPMKGKRLKLVDHDELTFATWKSEDKNTRVLRADPEIAAAGKYADADWEERMKSVPVVINPKGEGLTARSLIIGLKIGSSSKAYPFDLLKKQKLILDSIGGEPVFVVLHADGKSVRAFKRKINGSVHDFFQVDGKDFQLTDSQTASQWNFSGLAISGPLAGQKLEKVHTLKDYWFDWKNYNPQTMIYKLGLYP
jgi:hypothetical protein